MLIIFDLDDTLVDTFGCSIPVKMKEVVRGMIAAGLDVQFEEAYAVLMQCNEEQRTGEDVINAFGARIGAPEDLIQKGLEIYRSDAVLDFEMTTLPGARELLDSLKEKHTLALVTVGVEVVQHAKMQRAGIDMSVFSRMLFVDKYDKEENYRELSAEFNTPPSECIVIGDKVKTDLLPAKKLGMKTVYIKWGRGRTFPPDNGEVDYAIENLLDVKKIVEEL